MDLMEKFGAAAAKESIRQFCPPRCYELAGQELHFVLIWAKRPEPICSMF
ncbi:MAG: hypothetical protein IKF06_00740 [Lachnospiraceae bacterium]|nr:hypothetical protein [Lachnospiraceae bacterium]